MLKGSIVAIVTPMNADGSLDKKSLSRLIDLHLESGTDAIVINGTTGEAPTLTATEQVELVTLTVQQVKGRIPVIAGTGTNATQATIERTKNAAHAGADACLVAAPYYNKPTQKGLYAHYKAITDHCSLPIIIYNHPGRSGCDVLPETVEQLAKLPQIIGIKEGSGKVERCQDLIKRCGNEFAIYCGDDDLALNFMRHGAHGVISVVANIAPREMHEMCLAALSSDLEKAEKLNAALQPLHKNMFVETNPIPIKWALHKMGLIPTGIRLPLLPLDPHFHTQVRAALEQTGLLKTTNTIG